MDSGTRKTASCNNSVNPVEPWVSHLLTSSKLFHLIHGKLNCNLNERFCGPESICGKVRLKISVKPFSELMCADKQVL